MKKLVFMTAMLAVLAYPFAAMAGIAVDSVKPEYTTINSIDIKAGKIFQVRVVADIKTPSEGLSSADANAVKWSVTAPATVADELEIYVLDDAAKSDTETFTQNTDTTAKAYLWGSVRGAGDITITATLYSGDQATAQKGTATLTFSAEEAEADAKDPDATAALGGTTPAVILWSDTNDPRDYDSKRWNGLDPEFTNTINTDSYDIGKNKPKLGKVEKKDLAFEAGTSRDLIVPMAGPISTLNVYVAAKDALKLGWFEKGKEEDVPLTSASIRQYNIPFRVTGYSFAQTVSATGDTEEKLKKAQARAWKTAENSVTISFNGGSYACQGLPADYSDEQQQHSRQACSEGSEAGHYAERRRSGVGNRDSENRLCYCRGQAGYRDHTCNNRNKHL